MRLVKLHSKSELRAWRSENPGTVGFVPTMGALHAGHLSLVSQARARCARTIASIFVNPLQFGPNEDFSRYPRTLEADLEALESAGCDAVFLPSTDEMYPPGRSTCVSETTVSAPLCGAHRPGHFDGVTTVVLKLFNLVQPDFAFFGQKDAQQCAVIERMVRDLDVPVTVVRGETVREADGLALSSRNRYLTHDERSQALVLHRALTAVEGAWRSGERETARLEATGRAVLDSERAFATQYLEVRGLRTMERPERLSDDGEWVVAVAGKLGQTRLIDNRVLSSAQT
jgi:pantoate--beta-alanine ligase